MSYLCHHLFTKGKKLGIRCGDRVSKLDPEARYCARHRICVFLVVEKEDKVKSTTEPLKHINYLTFCQSLLFDPEELKAVTELFKK
jgi:hypothetical protein